jgi:hypothetical protein
VAVESLRLGVIVERMLCVLVERMMLCVVERGAWFAAEVEVEHIWVEHSEDGGDDI